MFDSLLRRSVQRITNCDLSDSQWIQASLPVKDEGLGIRRVSSLALPAFVASAASTLTIQALEKTFDGIFCSKLATMPESISMGQAFRITRLTKWHLGQIQGQKVK